jgi:DNA repair protein RecO (recombination protein O)
VARFELVLLRELGYRPALDCCAGCGNDPGDEGLAFSPAAGGVLCPACQADHRDRRPLSPAAHDALRRWSGDGPETAESTEARAEVRQVLNHYVTYLLGRRPRLLPYLGG